MFTLKLLNVVRIVGTEEEKSNLINQGFKIVEEVKEKAEEIKQEIVEEVEEVAKSKEK